MGACALCWLGRGAWRHGAWVMAGGSMPRERTARGPRACCKSRGKEYVIVWFRVQVGLCV